VDRKLSTRPPDRVRLAQRKARADLTGYGAPLLFVAGRVLPSPLAARALPEAENETPASSRI